MRGAKFSHAGKDGAESHAFTVWEDGHVDKGDAEQSEIDKLMAVWNGGKKYVRRPLVDFLIDAFDGKDGYKVILVARDENIKEQFTRLCESFNTLMKMPDSFMEVGPISGRTGLAVREIPVQRGGKTFMRKQWVRIAPHVHAPRMSKGMPKPRRIGGKFAKTLPKQDRSLYNTMLNKKGADVKGEWDKLVADEGKKGAGRIGVTGDAKTDFAQAHWLWTNPHSVKNKLYNAMPSSYQDFMRKNLAPGTKGGGQIWTKKKVAPKAPTAAPASVAAPVPKAPKKKPVAA